jgi:hypothetical protein
MKPDSRVIGEELLGAELVAGKELTEAAGSLFEAAEKGGAICREQARWIAEDYGRFWLSSLTRPGDPAPLVKLIEQRSEHIAAGMHDLGALVEREFVPLTRIWTDFFGLVARDWRQG